ncbi:unnamed protein product [Penicillium nalgiovense]|uniref:BHLH domain-containing protein n=1 Tax=Penicillium nalgiovense TaxID=60175 RepID=A0A1V6Z538_PENNA|nr:hypothetical protein PENNAL_c0003G10322 [Penicillium nalgiovense]CAG7947921.1 unnamed protein product [Penicillium nalgiovense]CAG7948930.1 unnamed protein product [Penicillium nalgiovense]CAG7949194.1 unnamed protein product [Penicillium nalgiovense]CAG7979281.1 unnamed protein product [Penicillium nalgiovense]
MSRLPTPAMSGGFTIKDKPDGDTFTLPPAALSNASRRSSRSDPSYVPVSPTSPELSGRRTSHTSRSGTSIKRPLEDFDLPPPPTRTRKIIQMKPKSPSKAPKTRENAKGSQSSEDPIPNPTTNSKRKQPSATSAAGRKIARKTAHSLIERRRRSKMNEEFGTLKDMIPACTGQEMHKLAILQASIDYVNYLEKCIRDMKTGGSTHTPAAPPSPTSPEFIAETGEPMQRDNSSTYSYSTSASPELNAAPTEFPDTSPSFSPRTQVPSANIPQDASSILPSPALGPVWASNEKMQEFQGVDHEASAALLMLTQDRRGTADSISENFPGGTALSKSLEGTPSVPPEGQRRKGMSVRDLLIS